MTAYGAGVAFDTPPLASAFHEIRDFTSRHLFSALVAQLFRFDASTGSLFPFACSCVSRNQDATEHTLKLRDGLTFSSGHEVEAADFVRGFHKALESGCPAAQCLDGLTDIAVDSIAARSGVKQLTLKSSHPDWQLLHKLAHPAFAPCASRGDPHDLGGPFTWIESRPLGGALKRRSIDGDRVGVDHIDYHIFSDPEEALEAYFDGAIDATCPALYSHRSLERMRSHPDFHEQLSSTFLVLFPTSSLALDKGLRTTLQKAVDVRRLAFQLNPAVRVVRGFAEPVADRRTVTSREPTFRLAPQRFRPTLKIRLGYDPFPPNFDVLQEIACQLSTVGVEVSFVEDDFLMPHADCDFRLVVVLNSFAYSVDAYRMIGRTPAVWQDKCLAERWWTEIYRYDAAQEDAGREAAVDALDALILEHAPVLLLGGLNQFGLRRRGLANFDWASDASWERI